jgi:hypothetical protein
VEQRHGYYVRGTQAAGGFKILGEPPGVVQTQGLDSHGRGLWKNDDHLWWTGAKPGDKLTVALPVQKAGTYRVSARLTKAHDYGIVQLYLDGAKAALPIDLFNQGVIPTTPPVSLGTHKLTAGEHKLTVEIVGANPKAVKGYMFGLDEVFLEPTEPGWRLLFNGQDFSGWQSASGQAPSPGWVVQEGAMVRQRSAGDIWTKERFGNFVLDLDFKTQGNSGIFIRTDKANDCVQTGIEIQIDRPSRMPGKHSVGAIYDALAPTKEVTRPGQWNHATITVLDSRIAVVLNGQQVIDMDLDKWTESGRNPDGTRNKFRRALKDFKREGHIGFQDHGAVVAYRNIRIRNLVSQQH